METQHSTSHNHANLHDESPRSYAYLRHKPEETILYKIVQENWETFQAQVFAAGRTLPKHVVKEFYEFLDCGILANGFFRVRCSGCSKERLLAFACRSRSFCPSCMGRRMNETAVFLVDHVLPQLPIRQWVLSFPFPIRYLLAKNPKHVTKVLKITLRVIENFYKKQGEEIHPEKKLKFGSVTAIQRFGGSVNLNVHFHALVPDGVFHKNPHGSEAFMRTKGPEDSDIQKMVVTLSDRIFAYFQRQGLLDGVNDHVSEEQAELMDEVSSASILSKIAFGPRAGQRVRRFDQLVELGYEPAITGPRCAYYRGFSLHANTKCEVWERKKLENLCKYINRPPVANDRVSITPNGQILYKMKSKYQDGTSHLLFDPLEFIEKLTALVPQPRMHMVRYHGVFAPNAKVRPDIVKRNKVPKQVTNPDGTQTEELKPETLQARISWAQLLKRVFHIDITKCQHCGGQIKILAAIVERKVIVKILGHLKLPTDPPVIHPARAPPQTKFEFH